MTMSKGLLSNGHAGNGSLHAPDIFSANSTAEIKAALAQLSQRDQSITSKLDNLISSQKELSRQLTRLDLARAQLGSQVTAVRSVSNGMLSSAASTAGRISGAVKRLDHEQAAVKGTLDVVEQVAELKACVLGVHGSMGAPQDWETAASYLSRASNIPDEVIDGAFAEDIIPTAEVPDVPRVTLEQAAESLCGLFLREFEKAAKDGDGARVTRFFKLFPLIGRTNVGLDAYGRYVCGGVSSRARNNLNTSQGKEGLFYAMALTKLFEHIAQIVEGHEPLVSRHYGPGMMTKVIERLQVEADLQGGIILDTWSEDRSVSRKITDIKSYAFSFLVQSFLSAQKSSQGGRSDSPGRHDGSGRPSEDEGVDMKEVDSLLGEMAMMLGRWALYARFIAAKTQVNHDEVDPTILALPGIVSKSNLQRKISDMLVDPLSIMSTFFFRRSVEKAFQMDEQPTGLTLNPHKPLGSNAPFITSAVDDVMYILNQVLQRTLGTSQRSAVAGVLPSVSRVLSSDFYGMIQRKMRDESYPKAAIQGALPPESVIIAFIVLVNNLDVSTDYVRRIINNTLGQNNESHADSAESRPPLKELFPFGHDSVFVENQLKNLLHTYETKTTELINEAVEVLLRQVMRPRLRPVLIETFRDIDYMPLEEDRRGDTDADDENAVVQRFERGWQAFTLPIKRIATDCNYDKLLSATISHLSKQLEKRIWSYYGRMNELGAIKLERDITGIVNIAVKGGKYQYRDMFARCTQMALVLNMDEEEWQELEKAGPSEIEEMGIQWQLDADERKRTRSIIEPS